jgi:hypothetical protein
MSGYIPSGMERGISWYLFFSRWAGVLVKKQIQKAGLCNKKYRKKIQRRQQNEYR